MHGVRRGSKPKGEAAAAELERARIHAEALRKALASRTSSDVAEAWKLTSTAVELHADEYSLWNWRRKQLLDIAEGRLDATNLIINTNINTAKQEEEEEETISFGTLWGTELSLTMRALKRHPKAYPCWQHRLWLLGCTYAPTEMRVKALKKEQMLSAHMLSLDGRNFHGWAHRLRVRALVNEMTKNKKNVDCDSTAEMEEELNFVTDKINSDFANYSAWHVRSKMLANIISGRKEGRLERELEYVRQAFYTEPDVQSTWFYHRWLLAGMPGDSEGECDRLKNEEEVWERELEACNELVEIEEEARWVLHTKAHILAHLGRDEEAKHVFEKLKTIDPMRRGFYEYKISKLEHPKPN